MRTRSATEVPQGRWQIEDCMIRRMRVVIGLAVSLLLMLTTVPVVAHHAFAAEFDANKPLSLTGTVIKMEWINPHVYLHLDVADESGNITPWRLETLPTAFLRKGQITRAMLLGDGEMVTVTGITAHKDPNLGWVHRITYSDGHYYQLGN